MSATAGGPGAGELLGGVETGGSWCVCALGRGPGELVAGETFATEGPAETLARIVAFFTDPARPRAAAIGVGAFGPLTLDERSPRWGELLAATPKPGWAGAAVGATLRAGLDVPVALDTDVGAAAVGEQRWGAARGAPSACYLTVGTGIGGALLQDGRPRHGLVHPEAGHLRIPHDRERDPFPGACPFHEDCWEGLASGHALALRTGQDPAGLPDDHPVWALEAEYLAAGLLAIALVASPHRIVVGGGVMQRAGLLAATRRELARLLGGYLRGTTLDGDLADYLVAPELGDDAGVLGAMALASDALVAAGRAER